MSIARFAFPTIIHFGPGARRLCGPRLKELGFRRPLVVTDRTLAAQPLVAEFKADLERAELNAAVYADVHGNPVTTQVMQGARAYRKHRADCVVGLGGGAALDVAKLVGVMATHRGDVAEYALDHPKARPITGERPYFIAVPTASGTGSEVSRSSVIGEEASGVQRVIFSPLILARAVYADPELTLGVPPDVTAATGMDALTHHAESYLSPVYHPMCDGIALEGMRIAARSLLTAVREPDNLAARGDMMMASMMGAVAAQKDLGAVHACAHALGSVCSVHHGLANALMIEPVMSFNQEAVPAKFDELARTVGAGNGLAFVPWLARLKQQIGIPSGLDAAGVRREQFARLVELAAADVCHATNPRPCTPADFERFFEEAF